MTLPQQTIGKQITFAQLFEEFGRVQIPIIQRDYAQGRTGQEDLRNDFLGALKEALGREDTEATTLDLDFVYGSGFTSEESNESKESFAPLDGQQRLTTLFLLHWYLAWNDNETSDFTKRFLKNEKSLLAYEVRPSSHDFFNRIAQYQPESLPAEIASVATWIKDSAWFFRSWEYDPTILSALTILDSIHQKFAGSQGYYRRLIDSKQPRITFQLLELRHFGLSDDLYIKMNARGKPLTPFENFKARLEQHLNGLIKDEFFDLHGRQVCACEYFSHKMDTLWADLFWSHRDKKTNLFDDRFMRLIRTVALVSIDTERNNADHIVTAIRGLKPEASFSRYNELGCLSEKTLRTLIALLDYWSEQNFEENGNDSHNRHYSTAKAFNDATSDSLAYPGLVRFGAFAKYITAHGSDDKPQLSQWMRVIHNLVENADVEKPSQLVSALSAIDTLINDAKHILGYLANGGEIKFFYSWQIQEERIKATLFLKDKDWQPSILEAESHMYFNGQIEFLLDFSGILDWWEKHESLEWEDSDNTEFFEHFNKYYKKAEAIFGPRGLKPFGDSLWEKALLSEGDYTLQQGKNQSFLQNASTLGSSKQHSWKTMLRGRVGSHSIAGKRKFVKKLLDSIDLDRGVEVCLKEKIATTKIHEEWRRMMVEAAGAISYCEQKMFRKMDGGAIYLISKQRTSSEHMELWSYHLDKTVIEKLDESGELTPFTSDYYRASGEDSRPCARIRCSSQKFLLKIEFISITYRFVLRDEGSKLHHEIIDYLTEKYKSSKSDSLNFFNVPVNQVELAIKAIVKIGQTIALEAKAENELQ